MSTSSQVRPVFTTPASLDISIVYRAGGNLVLVAMAGEREGHWYHWLSKIWREPNETLLLR